MFSKASLKSSNDDDAVVGRGKNPFAKARSPFHSPLAVPANFRQQVTFDLFNKPRCLKTFLIDVKTLCSSLVF